jgi:hypothetical protein
MSAFSLADDDIPMHHQPQEVQQQQPQPHSAGSILVVGSMDRMNEYQHLLQTLRSRDPQATVQGEMVDRFLQNGEYRRLSGAVERSEFCPSGASLFPLFPRAAYAARASCSLASLRPPPRGRASASFERSESLSEGGVGRSRVVLY